MPYSSLSEMLLLLSTSNRLAANDNTRLRDVSPAWRRPRACSMVESGFGRDAHRLTQADVQCSYTVHVIRLSVRKRRQL